MNGFIAGIVLGFYIGIATYFIILHLAYRFDIIEYKGIKNESANNTDNM